MKNDDTIYVVKVPHQMDASVYETTIDDLFDESLNVEEYDYWSATNFDMLKNIEAPAEAFDILKKHGEVFEITMGDSFDRRYYAPDEVLSKEEFIYDALGHDLYEFQIYSETELREYYEWLIIPNEQNPGSQKTHQEAKLVAKIAEVLNID